MKRLLFFMLAMMTLASCSKSESPAPTPTSPIVGDWTLQSGVQVITLRDGSVINRPITSTTKAHFDEDGTATDALAPFNFGRPKIPYAYNAATSKLVFGDGVIPYIFDVLVLTKTSFRLTMATPPSTGDGSFSVYSYNYTK